MILEALKKLEEIAHDNFSDIVLNTQLIHSLSGRIRKLRIVLLDDSYIDVWISSGQEYSYHWERRMLDNRIFRHDNAPHKKWKSIKSFPKHFHNGSERKVVESHISNNPQKAIVEFMAFVRNILNF